MENGEFWYQVTKGCLGRVEELTPFFNTFYRVYQGIMEGAYYDVFKVLGYVKENDDYAFFKQYPQYLTELMNTVELALYERADYEKLALCARERKQQTRITYTSEEFFGFLVRLQKKED